MQPALFYFSTYLASAKLAIKLELKMQSQYFPIPILCLQFLVSFSKPLGEDVSSGEIPMLVYIEKFKTNTSMAEMVMTFAKLSEIQPIVNTSMIDPRVSEPPWVNSSSSIINETIQFQPIDLNNNASLDPLIAINEHLQNPDKRLPQEEDEVGFRENHSEDDDTAVVFHFRGPGNGRPPPPSLPQIPIPTVTGEDEKAREAWGGDCLSEDWKRCSTIDGWGGNYYIKDKRNPGKFILKKDGNIPCVSQPRAKNKEKTYCLHNGFTVARCHMLCMSQCNNDYRIKYDKLVQHEGECANPLIG